MRSCVLTRGIGLLVLALAADGCAGGRWVPPPCPSCADPVLAGPLPEVPQASAPEVVAPPGPTVAEAEAFMARTEAELERLLVNAERAGWVSANFITGDTQEIVAAADEETMAFVTRAVKEAARYGGLDLGPELGRKLALLRLVNTLPSPSDPARTAELARIGAELRALYGAGKYCPRGDGALRRALTRPPELRRDADLQKALASCGPGKPGAGAPLDVLTKLMTESRDEEALREAWIGWHAISPPMRPLFRRYVEIGNEGAREIGFADVGALWRSVYDMPPEAFRDEVERLWSELAPLYADLHCYARKRLHERYGDKVPLTGPIPAHLFGNMWSQTWGGIYPLLEPFKGQGLPDVTQALAQKGYDELKMVKLAEGFFTSIGFDPLPETFWKRSLFLRPRDREVECHASAWDVHFDDDLRIKMCIQRTEEDLATIHHELGHNYHFHYYRTLPILFQQLANDGFREAVGDTITLSVTPGYLAGVGLLGETKQNDKADVNFLMKMALDKIAFLPFGKLIDQYRWDVFAGKIPPERLNGGWWELRQRYQGIVPPEPRTEEQFDAGAKYHVPANVPYTRYFLAFVYQFQLQRALCRIAGHQGPLHRCSIHGNKAAGDKLKALLALGASQPWPAAFAAATGEQQADTGALFEYFAPLRGWLKEQIKGERCGW